MNQVYNHFSKNKNLKWKWQVLNIYLKSTYSSVILDAQISSKRNNNTKGENEMISYTT